MRESIIRTWLTQTTRIGRWWWIVPRKRRIRVISRHCWCRAEDHWVTTWKFICVKNCLNIISIWISCSQSSRINAIISAHRLTWNIITIIFWNWSSPMIQLNKDSNVCQWDKWALLHHPWYFLFGFSVSHAAEMSQNISDSWSGGTLSFEF